MMEHLKINMNDNNVWQSIGTAPRDGTVILSDAGLVRFCARNREGLNGIGWYQCHLNGVVISHSDYGVYKEDPFWWMPIPTGPWQKKHKSSARLITI